MAETQTFQNSNNSSFPLFQQDSNLLQSDLQPKSSPPVTLVSPSFSSDLNTSDSGSPSFGSNQTNVPIRCGTSTAGNLASSATEDGGSVAAAESNGSTVFIGRLSKECTRDMVVSVFAIIGPISDIKFWTDRSYAFVSYLSPVSAAKAVFSLNGSCVFGSPIFVGWPSANGKKLRDQGSVPSSPSFSNLNSIDSGSNFARNETNEPIHGGNLTTGNLASSVSENGGSVDADGNGSTVFIGRLPNECTRDMIGSVFEKLGPISEIKLWTDRRYAFVSYDSPVSAANAVVCLNGSCVFGLPIFVGWSSANGKKQSDQGLNSSLCDLSIDTSVISSTPTAETILSHIRSLQETVSQVLINQKEGKRIETGIGKANFDAQWGRIQEEFSKLKKSNRDDHQQISDLVTNGFNDLLAAWEKMTMKETAALVHAVVSTVTPIIEKTLSTAISEAFQRGVGDKAINQIEKSVDSKLEDAVVRQIQAQFQTCGKQALQESLRLSMEGFVVPVFEKSFKDMFDQVDAAFQKGMLEHTNAAQQRVDSAHSPLAIALRDAISSVSSMTQTLSSELADGQRKLIALAANLQTRNSLISQTNNGLIHGFQEKIDAQVDPTKELSRLVYEHKFEEAFTVALQRSDVHIVSWLCSQVDLQGILTRNLVPLSQGVLLSLLQQLACDMVNDTSRKLAWMMDLVVAIKPSDVMIAMHVCPIFDQVYSILNHQLNHPTTVVSDLSSIRILMKLINSMLRSM